LLLLAPLFCQARSRLTAFAYLDALLAEPGDRRSCWQLAEAAGHTSPRRMQALLAEHAWDYAAALGAVQKFIAGHLGDPEAILVLDETAELKKGRIAPPPARSAPPGPAGGENTRPEPATTTSRHASGGARDEP
jgi:SRSO17 transposase